MHVSRRNSPSRKCEAAGDLSLGCSKLAARDSSVPTAASRDRLLQAGGRRSRDTPRAQHSSE
eukprot:3933811-Rhodomonas_salina.8